MKPHSLLSQTKSKAPSKKYSHPKNGLIQNTFEAIHFFICLAAQHPQYPLHYALQNTDARPPSLLTNGTMHKRKAP